MDSEQRSAIAALNVVNFKNMKLLSKPVPLIFDWNGEGEILSEIQKDPNFCDYLNEIVFNIENYSTSFLCFGYFSRQGDDNSKDSFKDNQIKVQIAYPLDFLDEKGIHLADEYLFDIYKDLYRHAFNKEYVEDESKSIVESIINIHNLIHAKYGDKFIKQTELNYARSVMNKKWGLHDAQINYVVTKLDKMFE